MVFYLGIGIPCDVGKWSERTATTRSDYVFPEMKLRGLTFPMGTMPLSFISGNIYNEFSVLCGVLPYCAELVALDKP
jgi:hypothetical protein